FRGGDGPPPSTTPDLLRLAISAVDLSRLAADFPDFASSADDLPMSMPDLRESVRPGKAIGAGATTRSRNSGTLPIGTNCPPLERPTRIAEGSPSRRSLSALRMPSVAPFTVCFWPFSSLYAMYQTSARPGGGAVHDGVAEARLWPVRSSKNSRQLVGRCAGSALIARRIAQSTRSETVSFNSFGAGNSFLIFRIQQSRGLDCSKGTRPVTRA